LKKCEKRAIKVMHKTLPEENTEIEPDLATRKRLKFDFDGNKKLDKSEYRTSNAVLNQALARTMIEVFDGFNGNDMTGQKVHFNHRGKAPGSPVHRPVFPFQPGNFRVVPV